jgi:hypothetical protein
MTRMSACHSALLAPGWGRSDRPRGTRTSRRRRAAWEIAAAVLAFALASPAAAGAAEFTSTPPLENPSGSSVEFSFQSTAGFAADSSTAYHLLGVSGWKRCVHPGFVRYDGLADGLYTLEIKDDTSLNYWASLGQLYSGHTAACQTSDPPNDKGGYTSFAFRIGPAPAAQPPAAVPTTPAPPVASPPTLAPAATSAPAPAGIVLPGTAPARKQAATCKQSRSILRDRLSSERRKRAAYKRHRSKHRRTHWRNAVKLTAQARRLVRADCH